MCMSDVVMPVPSMEGTEERFVRALNRTVAPGSMGGDAPVMRPPQTVSPPTPDAFAALGIVPPLCHALKAQGYSVPTPIQTRAIPF